MSESPPSVEARIPSSLAPPVAEKLQAAGRQRVAERLGRADATLWGPPGTPEIADRWAG